MCCSFKRDRGREAQTEERLPSHSNFNPSDVAIHLLRASQNDVSYNSDSFLHLSFKRSGGWRYWKKYASMQLSHPRAVKKKSPAS